MDHSTSLSPELLVLLLKKLGLAIEPGAVVHAWHVISQEMPALSEMDFVRELIKALQLPGVQVAQVRFKRFDLRRLPALIHHDGQWLLAEASGQTGWITTIDENNSVKELALDELEEALVLWLHVRQRPAVKHHLSNSIAARMVFSALFKSKRWLVDVAIATILVNFLGIATSIFAMQTYDRVVPTLAYATLTTMVVGMLIIIALDWLLKIIRARIVDRLSCDVEKEVSQKVFDHLMHLQLDQRPRSLGTLSAQVSGLDSVRQFFSSAVIFSLIDLPFALMFIFFIYVIGGPVSLVYLGLLPVAVILGWATQHRLRRLLREQMIRNNERQGLLVDAIRGSETIRASNASWRFLNEWQSITQSINEYNLKQKTISNLSFTTTGNLSMLAYVAAVVVGVNQIEDGNLTMGGLIACSILGGRVIAPIARGVQQLAQWQHVSQALQMVDQLLQLNRDRSAEQRLLMSDRKPEKIKLEGVRFSYGQSPVVQLDVPQLTFRAGDRVVLVGPIGCGKSTLLKVLAGMFRPSEGRVRLGDADLWEMEPNIVADQVGYLPQNVSLFKGTLQSNLGLSGAVNDNHLLQVVKTLGIDRIAAESSLNMGLEISEGGEGLSDGQKQLVGLARIFLAQPTIWLLDEPTASLDRQTEQNVFSAIEQTVGKDDILIVSTHKPMIASRFSNRVIAMQQGRILADDKPDIVLPGLMGQPNARNAYQPASNVNRGLGVGPGGIDVI